MSGKMFSTTVYFLPEVIARYRLLAEATKVPLSALYRDAIDRALQKWERTVAEGKPLTFGAEADACAKCESLAALHRRRS